MQLRHCKGSEWNCVFDQKKMFFSKCLESQNENSRGKSRAFQLFLLSRASRSIKPQSILATMGQINQTKNQPKTQNNQTATPINWPASVQHPSPHRIAPFTAHASHPEQKRDPNSPSANKFQLFNFSFAFSRVFNIWRRKCDWKSVENAKPQRMN